MDIMAYILALMLQWNAMIAAGYTYDWQTMKWTAPTATTQQELKEERRRDR